MGHSKWVGACALVAACYLAGQMVAQEPAANDPFGDFGEAGAPVAAATNNPFGDPASGAPPTVSNASDPFAVEPTPGPEAADTPTGEAERDAAESKTATSQSAQQRIEAALNQRLRSPIDFPQTPLNVIMQQLAEEYDISIHFDTTALEAVAQSPEIEVSAAYHGITLRSALELMLGQVEDVTYIIDNEVLIITTEDEAESRMLTVVYQVDDLLPRQGRDDNVAREASLVDVITRCVERDSWARYEKGEGEICILDPGVMVISQTQRVHDEVARLLAEIRRVKAAIKDRPTGGY
jgi:hypothetical protein